MPGLTDDQIDDFSSKLHTFAKGLTKAEQDFLERILAHAGTTGRKPIPASRRGLSAYLHALASAWDAEPPEPPCMFW